MGPSGWASGNPDANTETEMNLEVEPLTGTVQIQHTIVVSTLSPAHCIAIRPNNSRAIRHAVAF